MLLRLQTFGTQQVPCAKECHVLRCGAFAKGEGSMTSAHSLFTPSVSHCSMSFVQTRLPSTCPLGKPQLVFAHWLTSSTVSVPASPFDRTTGPVCRQGQEACWPGLTHAEPAASRLPPQSRRTYACSEHAPSSKRPELPYLSSNLLGEGTWPAMWLLRSGKQPKTVLSAKSI